MNPDKKSEIQVIEFSEKSWEMTYTEHDAETGTEYEAQCKFELSSEEDAVIYDLEVPEQISNRGIGTSMLELAEQIIKDETKAQHIYAQIGARNGATQHVLSEKFGYDIIGTEHRESLGKIVDAQKKISGR